MMDKQSLSETFSKVKKYTKDLKVILHPYSNKHR